MKKDELVHLHALLARLRSEFERRGVADPAAFADYDDLGLSPMAVYGSKTEHRRAVQALAGALAAAADEPVDDPGDRQTTAPSASSD